MDIATGFLTTGEQPVGGEAMPDTELVSILGGYEAQAIGYDTGGDGEITEAQKRALDYYNGTMDDLPAAEGTSSVVDGTVALVVDNGLAAVLKPFVSSDETVMFSPRGPEDVQVAEQATEYVNYIFNCDNPGFLILHNWFKDALLSKLGIIKVWWEESSRFNGEHVILGDELQAELIRRRPDYMGEDQGVAMVGQMINDGRVKVENVPPEEFRISPLARSVEDAEYVAHVPSNVTRSKLIEMGFDPEIVESLPAYSERPEGSTLRDSRYADEDNSSWSIQSANHKPSDRMAVRDEYVKIDYDGDGVAELRRIIRVDSTVLLNQEIDDNPFATLCPIPMPHKVFGHSIADRAMQEQKIGTAIWRQSLDNLYKSNNPRPVLGDGARCQDGSTDDSLADNAPGAAVLVRDVNQFRFDAVPFTSDKTFPMLELLDKKVEENTGISRAGQGLDTNALKKTGQTTATEMNLIAAGKNARAEMIARIFAETGVSRLFKLILGLVTKHQQEQRIIRLRNTFVPMDPRGWPEMDVQISVGLGIGDKQEQIFQAQTVLQTMETLGQTPYANLIDAEKVYNALKRLYNAAGIKNVDDFLNEPSQFQEMPEKPDPELVKAQAEAQLKAQELQGKQEEAALNLQLKREESAMKLQLMREEAAAKLELEQRRQESEAALALRQQDFEMEMARQQMALQREQAAHKASLDEQNAISKKREGGDLDK
ncbi:hypothetical protein K7W03_14400 [Sphingobium sp. PNB]|uniref:portal protein n=1 Tax=Sphingobium sp. PNB TaxID=863934 RepID=UPI001CA3D0E8|nr:hypothetical protein [Sphingobium sp. PNB]MCB4860782.1 hypothetical protein [Sphingobium sp. PNB]